MSWERPSQRFGRVVIVGRRDLMRWKLEVDKERRKRWPPCGLMVRARDEKGAWVPCDLAHLSRESLQTWMRIDKKNVRDALYTLLGHHLREDAGKKWSSPKRRRMILNARRRRQRREARKKRTKKT